MWGLLDFMSALSSSFSFACSSLSSCCQPSSANRHVQCSLPDLHCKDRDHLGAVFPAGPQRRPYALSVPCQTSTATICAQCSLPDLHRDLLRPVLPAEPQSRDRMSEDMSERMPDRMSGDMPEIMSETMAEDMSERMSKDMSERMSEDCLQSVREVESNRTHFRRWVVCLPSPDAIRLT